MTHYLFVWKQFLQEKDYDYLIQYVENIKNDIVNDDIINFSGPGRESLKNDCKKYLKPRAPIFTGTTDGLDTRLIKTIQLKSID